MVFARTRAHGIIMTVYVIVQLKMIDRAADAGSASPPFPTIAPQRRDRQERRRCIIDRTTVIHGIRVVGTIGIALMPMSAARADIARGRSLRLLFRRRSPPRRARPAPKRSTSALPQATPCQSNSSSGAPFGPTLAGPNLAPVFRRRERKASPRTRACFGLKLPPLPMAAMLQRWRCHPQWRRWPQPRCQP